MNELTGVLATHNEKIKELEQCQKSLFESIAKYTVCVLCHLERHQITQPSEESDTGRSEKYTFEEDESIVIDSGAGAQNFRHVNITPAEKAYTRIVGACMCKRFEFGFDGAYKSAEPQRKFKQFLHHIRTEVEKDRKTTTAVIREIFSR